MIALPVAAARTPASRSRLARTWLRSCWIVSPASAATSEREQRVARGARGVAGLPDHEPGHEQHERGGGEGDQQLAPGAVEREPDGGQDHEREEAGRAVAGLAHQPDDAEIGERQPELRRRLSRTTPTDAATSSASVSAQARPNSSGSRLGPGSSAAIGPPTTASPKAARVVGLASLAPIAQKTATRSATSAATKTHDRQLAPEQAALEALVGFQLVFEGTHARSPTVPVFSVFSQAISARRSSAT